MGKGIAEDIAEDIRTYTKLLTMDLQEVQPEEKQLLEELDSLRDMILDYDPNSVRGRHAWDAKRVEIDKAIMQLREDLSKMIETDKWLRTELRKRVITKEVTNIFER